MEISMEIIATNEEALIIEDNDKWYMYLISRMQKILTVIKKEKPNWYKACVLKWGFIPLKKNIIINNIKDIDSEIIDKANGSQKWKKDYVS